MTNLERMTNDQTTNHRAVASSFACHAVAWRRRVLCVSFVICPVVILMLRAQTMAQSPEMIGRWNVNITFGDGSQRAMRFEAQGDGKGIWQLIDEKAKVWGMPSSWPAKWAPGDGNSVTFSGNVEFPLGNVGRDAGTLMLKGKFETPDVITGEVEFAPLVGDRPTKHGTFKATRNHG
jgi:hypothetical protein